jgi:hypothetical protein
MQATIFMWCGALESVEMTRPKAGRRRASHASRRLDFRPKRIAAQRESINARKPEGTRESGAAMGLVTA